MSISFSKLDDACNQSIGYIYAYVSGGTAPYSFHWSNGAVINNVMGGDTLYNTGAGTYILTAYDAVGDSTIDSISIINTATLDRNGTLYIPFTNIDPVTGYASFSCPGQSNGIKYGILSVTQGTEPYTVLSPPGAYIDFSAAYGPHVVVPGLANNVSFSVAIADNNGCTGSFWEFGYGPEPIDPSDLSTLPACNGQNNGTLILDYFGWAFNVDINLLDSATGAFVSSATLATPGPTVISDSLYPGTYTMAYTYSNTVVPCVDLLYFTVADAGSNCGTISGKVYTDTIHDCIPGVNEPGIPSQTIQLLPGPYYATTDANGMYSLYLPFNTYAVSQLSVPPNYFEVCNSSPVTINAATPTAVVNIGDTLDPNLDLSIGLAAGEARPGFNLNYSIWVSNNSLINSGPALVTFTVDTVLQFVSCSYPHSYLGNGVYTVQLPAINKYTGLYIYFNFAVPPNPALIGNTLFATATVTNPVTEPYLANNTTAHTQLIVGAVDPNAKAVWPARDVNNTFLTDVDSVLTYTIFFQNTGTASAINIVVTDTLSSLLDLSTLQIQGASHPMTWSLEGAGVLKFTFNNIMLPDSNANEPLSHGYVTYTVRPLNNLMLQTVIPNTANIYFDFNPPVITNTITSLIDISVNVKDAISNSCVSLVPNPATDFVTVFIKNADAANSYSLRITNMQGQQVMYLQHVFNKQKILLNALPSGCYFYSLQEGNSPYESRQGKIVISCK